MTAPTPRSSFRIAIVEDHVLLAESLELALTLEGYDVTRVDVPPDDRSPAALLSRITRHHPRVALLDLDLGPFGDGTRLITPLAGAGVNVVVLTASADRARWGEAVRSGARTVVTKSRPLNDVMATVRRINQGLPVMTPQEREDLLRAWGERRSAVRDLRRRIERLTTREREVLGALMLGRTVREIAAVDVVSEATVRTQVKSILAKLEVSSQLAAVGMAHRVGWRPAPPVDGAPPHHW